MLYNKQIANDIELLRNKQIELSHSEWHNLLPAIFRELRKEKYEFRLYLNIQKALNSLCEEKTFRNIVHFDLPIRNEAYGIILKALGKVIS